MRRLPQKKYPIVNPPIFCEAWNRPGIKFCTKCHDAFQRKDKIAVIETQVSWFRGDDEVEAFHKTCYALRRAAVER